MSVLPLFVASMPTLKASLRLTGATQTDAVAMVETAVGKVRTGFYDALGIVRVSEILAMAYAENPTTAGALTRLKANNVEISWVKLELLRSLPILFMDSSGEQKEIWNREGLTRKASDGHLEAEMERLQAEISANLPGLMGEEVGAAANLNGGIQVSTIGPATVPDGPGDSIKPFTF